MRYEGLFSARIGKVDKQAKLAIFSAGDTTSYAKELTFSDTPCIITWQKTKLVESIHSAQLEVNMIAKEDADLREIFESKEDVFCVLAISNKEIWRGKLANKTWEEPFSREKNYSISATFSDFNGLKRLTLEDFKDNFELDIVLNSLINIKTFFNVIFSAVRGVGTEVEWIDCYLPLADPIDNLNIATASCYKGDDAKDLYEVVEGILQAFCLHAIQYNGKVVIFRPDFSLKAIDIANQVASLLALDTNTRLGVDDMISKMSIDFNAQNSEKLSDINLDISTIIPQSVMIQRKYDLIEGLVQGEYAFYKGENAFQNYEGFYAGAIDYKEKVQNCGMFYVSSEASNNNSLYKFLNSTTRAFTPYVQTTIVAPNNAYMPSKMADTTGIRLSFSLSMLISVGADPFQYENYYMASHAPTQVLIDAHIHIGSIIFISDEKGSYWVLQHEPNSEESNWVKKTSLPSSPTAWFYYEKLDEAHDFLTSTIEVDLPTDFVGVGILYVEALPKSLELTNVGSNVLSLIKYFALRDLNVQVGGIAEEITKNVSNSQVEKISEFGDEESISLQYDAPAWTSLLTNNLIFKDDGTCIQQNGNTLIDNFLTFVKNNFVVNETRPSRFVIDGTYSYNHSAILPIFSAKNKAFASIEKSGYLLMASSEEYNVRSGASHMELKEFAISQLNAPSIKVFPYSVIATNESGGLTLTIGVEGSTSAWNYSKSGSFITVTKQSNSQVNVIFTKNTLSSARTARIDFYLTSDSSVKTSFNLTQNAEGAIVTYYLFAQPSNMNFIKVGGSERVTLDSNGTPKVLSSPAWITASLTSIKVSENSSGSERNGNVVYSVAEDNNVQAIVEVSQSIVEDYYLTVEPTSLEVKGEGEVKVVNFSSNGDVRLKTKPSWVTEVGDNKSSQLTIEPNASTSARSGNVVFELLEDASKTASVAINQAKAIAYAITASPSSLKFSAEGGTQTSIITTNGTWRVKSFPSWATVTKSGNTLSIVVSAYSDTSENRVANVVVECVEDPSKTATISLSQATYGYYLEVNPNVINSSAQGGTGAISVTCNGTWRVKSNPSWTSYNIVDEDLLSLTIDENYNTTARTGSVVVECVEDPSKTATISLSQATYGYYLEVNPNVINSSAQGGTGAISVTCNGTWRVKSNPSWTSYNIVDEDLLSLTIDENYNTTARTGSVVVECVEDPSKTATISVIQAKAGLVPAEYTQLTYIECDFGTESAPNYARIDLDYLVTPNSVIEWTGQLNSKLSAYASSFPGNEKKLFGTDLGFAGLEVIFVVASNKYRYRLYSDDAAYQNYNNPPSDFFNVKIGDGKFVVNGETIQTILRNHEGTGTLFLGYGVTGSNNNPFNHYFFGKHSYLKITESGEAVVEMYPARRKSDGAVGLYDVVRKEFFEADSIMEKGATNIFTAGDPV